MLKKLDLNDVTSKEFCEALMELRNTPRADGRSPNEIVFGHNLYSKVPVHHTSFDAKWIKLADEADAKTAKIKEKVENYYYASAHDL